VISVHEMCMSSILCVTVIYLNMYLNNSVQIFKHAFYDFCTLLVFKSTAVVLCNYNKNTFVCLYVVCTCANTFDMLCICREFHGVSVL